MSDAKTIRDPIHGDIPLSALEVAIVNSVEFQRLRYIRQNGLLHFVFPGAVHTRFAHSIGAMFLARRVFTRLFPEYSPMALPTSNALCYVGAIFELAALLHDIVHCAFSHSIERVNLRDLPFIHQMSALVTAWKDNALTEWWGRKVYPEPDRTEHEDLGALFVVVLFGGVAMRR